MLTPERTRELSDHALRIIMAIASRDPDAMPDEDACGVIDNAEWWGMTCAALCVIDHLTGQLPDGAIAGWVAETLTGEPVDLWTVDPGAALAASILTKYRSGDLDDALQLATARPDLAPDASAQLFQLAGALVRRAEGTAA